MNKNGKGEIKYKNILFFVKEKERVMRITFCIFSFFMFFMKKFYLAIPFFLLSIFLSGCSLSSQNENSSSSPLEVFSFTKPTSQPNTVGTLKSLVGNEAIISTRDMTNIPEDVKKY